MKSHLSFGADPFGEYSFSSLYDGSPWFYFNTNYDTFTFSAATNYEVAGPTIRTGSQIACGVNSAITQLPAGFRHRAILTAQNGINQCYTTWGNALLALAAWPTAATGYVLEGTTNLVPPVVWSQISAPIISSNGKNVVTITTTNPAGYYRLKQ